MTVQNLYRKGVATGERAVKVATNYHQAPSEIRIEFVIETDQSADTHAEKF